MAGIDPTSRIRADGFDRVAPDLVERARALSAATVHEAGGKIGAAQLGDVLRLTQRVQLTVRQTHMDLPVISPDHDWLAEAAIVAAWAEGRGLASVAEELSDSLAHGRGATR